MFNTNNDQAVPMQIAVDVTVISQDFSDTDVQLNYFQFWVF